MPRHLLLSSVAKTERTAQGIQEHWHIRAQHDWRHPRPEGNARVVVRVERHTPTPSPSPPEGARGQWHLRHARRPARKSANRTTTHPDARLLAHRHPLTPAAAHAHTHQSDPPSSSNESSPRQMVRNQMVDGGLLQPGSGSAYHLASPATQAQQSGASLGTYCSSIPPQIVIPRARHNQVNYAVHRGQVSVATST